MGHTRSARKNGLATIDRGGFKHGTEYEEKQRKETGKRHEQNRICPGIQHGSLQIQWQTG